MNFDYDTHFSKLLTSIAKSLQAIVKNYNNVSITISTVDDSTTLSGKNGTYSVSASNVSPAESS